LNLDTLLRIFFFFNWVTGGGIIPGQSSETVIDGMNVKVRNSGKKAYLWESNLRAFHVFMYFQAILKEFPYIDFEVIRQKKRVEKINGKSNYREIKEIIIIDA